jgi:hypothetical protein
VIICRLSKRARFIACKEEITAEECAKLFRKHIFKIHGLPREIISDRDTKFSSLFWQELGNLLGTEVKLAVSHHQQTNGGTERVNQTIEDFLRCFVNEKSNDWDEWLDLAEFAYNSRVHESTKLSPFQTDLGYQPHCPTRLLFPSEESRSAGAEEFAKLQAEVIAIARHQLVKAQERMKEYYDQGRKDQQFNIGDQVLLLAEMLSTQHSRKGNKKLSPKWVGPYEIIEVVNPLSYTLKLPANLGRLHPVFHTSSLKPYINEEDKREDQEMPQVRLADGTLGYQPEVILSHRTRNKKIQYQVRWVGYGDVTWEPEENLEECPLLIEAYWTKSGKEKPNKKKDTSKRRRRVRFS